MKKKSEVQGAEEKNSFSLLTDFDIHLFRSGKHFKLYEKLGAHPAEFKNQSGTYFAVWAPNAKSISIIGNFNHWQHSQHKLNPRWDESGIWEGFFPGVGKGEAYKYAIHSNTGEYLEKADPFARYAEIPTHGVDRVGARIPMERPVMD
jgi:1,4-alpha-glucan branching enzyme